MINYGSISVEGLLDALKSILGINAYYTREKLKELKDLVNAKLMKFVSKGNSESNVYRLTFTESLLIKKAVVTSLDIEKLLSLFCQLVLVYTNFINDTAPKVIYEIKQGNEDEALELRKKAYDVYNNTHAKLKTLASDAQIKIIEGSETVISLYDAGYTDIDFVINICERLAGYLDKCAVNLHHSDLSMKKLKNECAYNEKLQPIALEMQRAAHSVSYMFNVMGGIQKRIAVPLIKLDKLLDSEVS